MKFIKIVILTFFLSLYPMEPASLYKIPLMIGTYSLQKSLLAEMAPSIVSYTLIGGSIYFGIKKIANLFSSAHLENINNNFINLEKNLEKQHVYFNEKLKPVTQGLGSIIQLQQEYHKQTINHISREHQQTQESIQAQIKNTQESIINTTQKAVDNTYKNLTAQLNLIQSRQKTLENNSRSIVKKNEEIEQLLKKTHHYAQKGYENTELILKRLDSLEKGQNQLIHIAVKTAWQFPLFFVKNFKHLWDKPHSQAFSAKSNSITMLL
jgi:hypothetical protein